MLIAQIHQDQQYELTQKLANSKKDKKKVNTKYIFLDKDNQLNN